MPLYDYKCADHGIFHELVAMDASGDTCACPQCGQASARVILLSPALLDMDRAQRKAHATNEKARHEPHHSSRERRENDHEHGNGCGCQSKPRGSKLFYTAEGNKMFPSMRPWMISH